MSDVPNRLNYWLIFISHIQFTNLAAGRIKQPGGPRVGDPWTSVWAVLSFLISSKQALEQHLQLGHDRFLQRIFHFTIPTAGLNPKTSESGPQPHILFNIYFYINLPSTPWSSGGLLP